MVRVAAQGACLASENQSIIINEFKPAKEDTPTAVFSAASYDGGILSKLSYMMMVKLPEQENWTKVSEETTQLELKNLQLGDILVYKKGNGSTTSDSETQTIAISRAFVPALKASQPSSIGGKGTIPTTSVHEYSSDDGNTWTKAEGEIEVAPGTYLVRVAAQGDCLASENQSIIINEFVPPVHKKFDDVQDGEEWYYTDIYKAVDLGLMTGYTGTNLFGPGDLTTREQEAVVLWRAAGKPGGYPEIDHSKFPDAEKVSDWANEAMRWAISEGVVTGFIEGDIAYLKPQDNITREQLAVMIQRQSNNKKINEEGPAFSDYPDAKDVSSWAIEGMKWSISWKIVRGNSGFVLPQNNANRAELATMSVRAENFIM